MPTMLRGSVAKSSLEDEFEWQLRITANLPFVREYRFDKTRRWRFDFALPKQKLAVEIEGGVFSGGRHTRGKGFTADLEKYNAAALQGWCVLRYTAKSVKDGSALTEVLSAVSRYGYR